MVQLADSAYYGADGAAISSIPDDGWIKTRYPKAIFDEELRQWVSDAELAETVFTAFTSRGTAGQVTAG